MAKFKLLTFIIQRTRSLTIVIVIYISKVYILNKFRCCVPLLGLLSQKKKKKSLIIVLNLLDINTMHTKINPILLAQPPNLLIAKKIIISPQW